MPSAELLWQPTDERAHRSQMYAFTARMAAKYGFAADYPSLHRWSITRRDQFWKEMFDLAGIQATKAATAVEIAADLVVRKELQSKGKLDAAFVNCLLEWANGIVEKMDRLILPLFSGSKQFTRLKKHKSVAGKIDEKRNAIVQRSKICTEREATIVINKAKTIIESLVKIYNPGFSLSKD